MFDVFFGHWGTIYFFVPLIVLFATSCLAIWLGRRLGTVYIGILYPMVVVLGTTILTATSYGPSPLFGTFLVVLTLGGLAIAPIWAFSAHLKLQTLYGIAALASVVGSTVTPALILYSACTFGQQCV